MLLEMSVDVSGRRCHHGTTELTKMVSRAVSATGHYQTLKVYFVVSVRIQCSKIEGKSRQRHSIGVSLRLEASSAIFSFFIPLLPQSQGEWGQGVLILCCLGRSRRHKFPLTPHMSGEYLGVSENGISLWMADISKISEN